MEYVFSKADKDIAMSGGVMKNHWSRDLSMLL